MKLSLVAASLLSVFALTNAATTQVCEKKHSVISGDTCQSIASKYSISEANLQQWNRDLKSQFDCANVKAGDSICVKYASPSAKRKRSENTTESAKPTGAKPSGKPSGTRHFGSKHSGKPSGAKPSGTKPTGSRPSGKPSGAHLSGAKPSSKPSGTEIPPAKPTGAVTSKEKRDYESKTTKHKDMSTGLPTDAPSGKPSGNPSGNPSSKPSRKPSGTLSPQPTNSEEQGSDAAASTNNKD